jgi:hypothetical protein
MYGAVVMMHSWWRWLVLAGTVAAVVVFALALSSGRARTPKDRRLALLGMVAWDVQFLGGLALYVWLSPVTQAAFQNMGAAMKDAQLRFFAVEHTTLMLLGLVFVHLGFSKMKRAKEDKAAFKGAALFYGLALACMVLGIPWVMRPLFRL